MTAAAKPDTWMPLVIGDYLKDTGRLSTEQHGAYLLLIMDYWVNGPPADDDAELSSITRLDLRTWRKHRESLAKFFHLEGGHWRHKRVDAELERWSEKKEKYAARAAAAAEKRWASEGRVAGEPRSKRLSDARARGTHTPAQWERMVAFFGCCVRCGHRGELVKDHIVPVYKKGSDDIENIQPLCRSCNAGKSGETIDYRGAKWREAIFAPASTPTQRLLDASQTPSPQPASTEVEASNKASTLSGRQDADAHAESAPSPSAPWSGPENVWAAFSEALGEPWCEKFLRPCRWQDVPDRALIPPHPTIGARMLKDCKPLLAKLGLQLLEKAA